MTTTPPTGFLTDAQRRRAQAFAFAVELVPLSSDLMQTRIARWIVTGRWS